MADNLKDLELIKKTIIAKPFDSKLSNDEKQELLIWRNTFLKQVKHYFDNNHNPTKVNAIDPTKDNFTQPLSFQKLLYKLEISKDDYYRALSISKEEDLETDLKRQSNSCFFNNYFGVSLKV